MLKYVIREIELGLRERWTLVYTILHFKQKNKLKLGTVSMKAVITMANKRFYRLILGEYCPRHNIVSYNM